MMQERALSGERNPTERRRADRSAQRERTTKRFLSPGLIVTIRKTAAVVSGAETGCELATAADAWALMGSDSIRLLCAQVQEETHCIPFAEDAVVSYFGSSSPDCSAAI